jgi:hypothetical protein
MQPDGTLAVSRSLLGRRRAGIALAVAAACVMAGYGLSTRLASDGPAAPAEQAPVPDPCALLTNADVAKVFGAKVAYRTPDPDPRYRACSWSGWPNRQQYGQMAVTIDVARVTRAEFDRAYSTWIVAADGFATRRPAKSTPIHGVGEAAYAQVFAGAQLEVYYRGLVISVETTMLPEPLAAEKRLAAAAIARLERARAAT